MAENTLNRRGNHIVDKGARALAGNTTLISLDLRGNQITARGKRAFVGNPILTHSSEIQSETVKNVLDMDLPADVIRFMLIPYIPSPHSHQRSSLKN